MEGGDIVDIYNKRTLLPFSENSSFLFRNKQLVPLERGASQQSITIRGERVTPLICSEVIFPALSRKEGGSLIVNVSNDSVFKSPLVGQQKG